MSHWREENTSRAVEALMFHLIEGKQQRGAPSPENVNNTALLTHCVCVRACLRAQSCALRSRSRKSEISPHWPRMPAEDPLTL